jgi:hypothetical protein
MQRFERFVLPIVLTIGLLALSSASAFDPPAGGWDYVFDANAGQDVDGGHGSFTSLDGTYSHDNGSDSWDGSAPGDVDGRPGGAGIFADDDGSSYLRIQDTGDPRFDDGGGDPSNRKVYFGHDLGPDGATATA